MENSRRKGIRKASLPSKSLGTMDLVGLSFFGIAPI